MKIEIGESIIMSWLRHAKNCQIVQMNWKPSVSAWNLYNEDLIEEIIEKCQTRYNDKYGLDLFKNNSSSNQLIQQGEIDVLGIEVEKCSIKNIYAVDVAFHENGLNYGSRDVTIARVLKKMIRGAITLIGYYDTKSATIIFASPKIHKSVLEILRESIMDLNTYISTQWKIAFKFTVICNEDFENKIFNVITALSNSVADTSELFMRSVQLYRLFESERRVVSKNKVTRHNTIVNKPKHTDGYEEIKIGALVKSTFPKLMENKMISKKEVDNLLDKNYSKRTFNLNYPMLRKIIRGVPVADQKRDENGYNRYYSFIIKHDGEQYLLTSQWYEWNKPHYIVWLQQYLQSEE